jgi:hypothetical protein
MTHSIEYQKIDQIDVGISKAFALSLFGNPKVIKNPDKGEVLEYNYYFNKKFLLGLIFDQDRMVGYWVISLIPSFMPSIPFSEYSLLDKPIEKLSLSADRYVYDTHNVTFYLESEQLPQKDMLLKRYLAWINYGAAKDEEGNSNQSAILKIAQLGGLKAEETESDVLMQFRHKVSPNLFALGDVRIEQIADSLLTYAEYEYLK